jgi:lipopolysaccharide transport system permease protein
MSDYIGAVWRCRYFWLSLVQMDLRSRYRRSLLGLGWSLLQPIAMTAVLCTVFSTVFNLGAAEYAPTLLVGLCFWNFVTACTLQGCSCLQQGEKYIRQYPAPIAIYPLRVVLGASFHFAMGLLIVLVLKLFMSGPGGLAACLSLLPTMTLLLAFGWALAVLAGFATAYFPDVRHLAEVGLQILFYGTPIIYPSEMLRTRGMGWVVDCNPLAAFIELLRAPLLAGEFPSLDLLALGAASAALVSGAAVLVLVRLQKTIVFQL